MGYVPPNTIVQFFGELGLSPNYENSLYFATEAAKDAYFSNIPRVAQATQVSYTRAERGIIRVEIPIYNMYRVGYMRFQNSSFENKWIYAFVTGIEYINNLVTQVRFEIDVLMTWMGTFQLGQCFIERQHTVNDYIGANIADEGLDTGEYITEYRGNTGILSGGWAICLFTSQTATGTTDPTPVPATGAIYCGVYSGCQMIVEPATAEGASHINAYLEAITQSAGSEAIACIMMLPYTYAAAAIVAGGTSAPFTVDIPIAKPYSDIAGYVPKNKKLFTYPYKCLSVYNSEGNSVDYKYEYFNTLPDQQSTGVCTFNMKTLISSNPLIALYPLNYKGQAVAYDEQIDMRHFTTCNYAIDTWKAYYAMNKSTIDYDKASAPWMGGLGVGLGMVGMLASGATGNVGGFFGGASQVASSVDSIGRTMARHKDYERMPNVSKGVANNDLMTADQTKDFYFEEKCITKNYAMMIDDYFTMFGYAIKQVATPNMNARPYFTYVKTIGCSVHGNLPSDDAAEIESIFDRGVRFWKNHSNIGNYSLNNAPT